MNKFDTKSTDNHLLHNIIDVHNMKFVYIDHNSIDGDNPHIVHKALLYIKKVKEHLGNESKWNVLGLEVNNNSVFSSIKNQRVVVLLQDKSGYIYKQKINYILSSNNDPSGTYKKFIDDEYNDAKTMQLYMVEYIKNRKEKQKPLNINHIMDGMVNCTCTICNETDNYNYHSIISDTRDSHGGCKNCRFFSDIFVYNDFLYWQEIYKNNKKYVKEYTNNIEIPLIGHSFYKHFYSGDSADNYTQRIINKLNELNEDLVFEGYSLENYIDWRGNNTPIIISYKGYYCRITITDILDSERGYKMLISNVDQTSDVMLTTDYLTFDKLIINRSKGHNLTGTEIGNKLNEVSLLYSLNYNKNVKFLGFNIKNSRQYKGISTKLVIEVDGKIIKDTMLYKFINSSGIIVANDKLPQFKKLFKKSIDDIKNHCIIKQIDQYEVANNFDENYNFNNIKPYDIWNELYTLYQENMQNSNIKFHGIILPFSNRSNAKALFEFDGKFITANKYDTIFKKAKDSGNDQHELYIQKLCLNGSPVILKLGIAKDTNERIKTQIESGSIFEHQKVLIISGTKKDIMKYETILLKLFGNTSFGACGKSMLPSGFSETIPLYYEEEIYNFINDLIKNDNNLKITYKI